MWPKKSETKWNKNKKRSCWGGEESQLRKAIRKIQLTWVWLLHSLRIDMIFLHHWYDFSREFIILLFSLQRENLLTNGDFSYNVSVLYKRITSTWFSELFCVCCFQKKNCQLEIILMHRDIFWGGSFYSSSVLIGLNGENERVESFTNSSKIFCLGS